MNAEKKNEVFQFLSDYVYIPNIKRGEFCHYFKREYFSKKGVKFLETNPELEENKNIQLFVQDYHPVKP